MSLSEKKCIPCKGGVPVVKGDELLHLYKELGGDKSGWRVVDERHIEKEYGFDSYIEGLEFSYQLGKLAEENGHHPIMLVDFKRVKVMYFTHKINGLCEADFIMAAKTDLLVENIVS